MKYSVLLPTYNESKNLPIVVALLVDTFSSLNAPFEIIIIDDSSPDGTFQTAQSLAATLGSDGQIKPFSRPSKLGLASAYQFASQYATGDFVIIMDADLSHHPKYLAQFINLQRRHSLDIVTGSRYALRGNGGVVGWPLQRKLTSVVANTLAAWLLLLPSNAPADLTGSFRLFKKPVFDALLSECITKGYTFQMEIIARAVKHGYKIGEVPIVFVDRVFGESKMSGKEICNFINGLWQLMFQISA